MRPSSRLKATRREALAGWAERIAQDPNNVETHNNRRVFYFREVPYPSAALSGGVGPTRLSGRIAFSFSTTGTALTRAHSEKRIPESEATVTPNDRYTGAPTCEGHRQPRGHRIQLQHRPLLDPRLET